VSRVGLPERQALAQSRRQVNLADTLLRLGVVKVKRLGPEVDVPPAERERLTDPQAAASEHGK
jgi:hypothetical protein